ncbi:carboxylesterase family protein [Streptomyces sp. NPDC047072]|uniref:carboxylesterase family protein n=1 Tax=Streptomyces sp. NPDC047072 TaxID=3154809 RepID=UPI0033EDD473
MTMTETSLRTPVGTVVGHRVDGVRRYLGIPYAEAPIGVRRFAPPVPRAPFRQPYDATRPGPTSQRVPLFATTTIPEPSIPGDDVLNVSVTVPEADGCPVLVWIHGGGFLAGSPASPWYDGRSFARAGVVTVTVGYRLGVDGFAVLDGVPRNLGLRDVLLALDWVQENIAAFGGDPARVTVAGQSAGGAAVLALLSSPAARGRFRRAVSISGGFFEGTHPEVARPTREFLARLGRALAVPPTRAGFADRTLEQLQRAVLDLRGPGPLPLGPFVGDDILPVPVAEGLKEYGHDVPLLLGATGDEFDGDRTPAEEQGDGTRPAPEDRSAGTHTARAARAAGTRPTDTLFRAVCPRSAAARRHASAGTWLYSFEWPSPVLGGAVHCVDLPFFFDLLDASGVPEALGPNPPTDLATRMHADLVGFVHGETPPWDRATGTPGDPAREYGRPGAPLAADTHGVYDPVTRTEAAPW